MKILSIDEMLDAAHECLAPEEYQHAVQAIEQAATNLGETLARHVGIEIYGPATFESGFGGTCVAFKPRYVGQECPHVLDKADPGGDWE